MVTFALFFIGVSVAIGVLMLSNGLANIAGELRKHRTDDSDRHRAF